MSFEEWHRPPVGAPFHARWKAPSLGALRTARGQRELQLKERAALRRLAEARGELQRAAEAKKRLKQMKTVYTPTQAELDLREVKKVKKAFVEAGFKTHIRDGGDEQANLHKMPGLIPIPKTFEEGHSDDVLCSYAARKAMDNTKLRLIDPMSGYVKNQMLPLYVRNTQIEKNGTSKGGDQTQVQNNASDVSFLLVNLSLSIYQSTDLDLSSHLYVFLVLFYKICRDRRLRELTKSNLHSNFFLSSLSLPGRRYW